MTIDDLALLMKGEFNKIDGRFEKMEGQIGQLSSDIYDLKEKVTDVDHRLTNVEGKIDDLYELAKKDARFRKTQEIENISNISAHDRFNNNFVAIKDSLKVKDIKAEAV